MSFKNVRLFKLLVLGCLSLNITSCKNEHKSVKPIEITFKKEGELNLYKSTSDSIKAKLDIEIADNEYETQTGLMYRNTMKGNRGMLFIFNNEQERYFYMKNTKIPLDIIYISADKKIVSFQKHAKPLDETSLPSNYPAKYVLEVNAGQADAWSLAVGDSISFSNITN
ncbi:hypothetical protein GCM10007962_29360 [Yeosuana aromativorans]|uniref:DUF192 domain-containing protein n=1 Tax=Yeosuana aromativorans TaxID=288019 RepID=A0A8J3BSW0_9FLAO|nr:DUF192 domain-containing protein [Yeosuana aromativorans]GGK33126.1 hypothetical protein GCM10007962_29360 [Yeosuana aromativorans]